MNKKPSALARPRFLDVVKDPGARTEFDGTETAVQQQST